MKKILSILIIALFLLTMNITIFAETQYSDDLCTDASAAFASSYYTYTGYTPRVPSRAFDDSNTNYFYDAWEAENTSLPQWIAYDFGISGEIIRKYTMTGDPRFGATNTPKAWIFQGSNDQSTWVDLHQGNADSWSNSERKEFTFENDTAYRYYRIYITELQGGTGRYLVIGEIEMMSIVLPVPGAPTNLATAVEDGNVILSWDTVAGASTYNVKRSLTSGGTYETIATSVSEAVYEDNSVEVGITYYYVVSAENMSGESENSNEVSAMVQKDLELDIEADKYTLSGNTEFEVQVVINEANSIYAEDITIAYNTDLFEYISEETANPDNMEIYYKDTDTSGVLRYIVASKGAEYGLDDTAQILTLRFTTKNVSGEGEIKVASGLVADGDGIEYEPICRGKTFTVNVIDTDVNRDGEYTLGDLAIAGKLFDTEESSWEPFYPDVDSDNSVTEFDLQYIVESIMNQN